LFAREANAGWAEWLADKLPTHSATTVTGFACACSDKL